MVDRYAIKINDRIFDELHLNISGKVSMANAGLVRSELIAVIKAHPLKNVVVDLGEVEYFDSAGAAVLSEMFRLSAELNNRLRLANVPPRIQKFLDLVDLEPGTPRGILEPITEPDLLIQIGDGLLKGVRTTQDIVTFIGAVVLAVASDVIRPGKFARDRGWKLIEKAGSDAVPIVMILGFLQGAVLAFQAAIQLRKFGANLFVADLVSVAICLEMGPLLTSIIVAGRSGAAYAAHIGTMQVNEEVDALRIMGIDPIRYLVSPRVLAVAVALPCLTLFSDLMGTIGGSVVATISLDMTATTYFDQVRKVLEVTDVAKGLVKSFVFGLEIAIIGCLRGFQVRGGAEGVGAATTSAVVTSVFVLTVTDAVFAVLFHYAPAW